MLDWMKDNLAHVVTVPMLLSIGNFGLLLLKSLSDGVLTDAEIHNLMQTSSGINMLILCAVMMILRQKK